MDWFIRIDEDSEKKTQQSGKEVANLRRLQPAQFVFPKNIEIMKRLNYYTAGLTAAFFLLAGHDAAHAQASAGKLQAADPIRGHYKSLAAFSPAPAGEDQPADAIRYPVSETDLERAKQRQTHYLTANEDFNIPAFPANSSEQTRKELDYLLQLQAQRFKEDMDMCLYMADVWFSHSYKLGDKEYPRMRRNLFFIGRSIGTWFNADSLPATAELVANVWRDASFYIWKYKNHFARARPYVLEPKIQNLQVTNWPAYPSGHAANSYVNAYLFTALAPEFKDMFIKDALDMAHSRERIGVHFPSDSEASRQLAQQLINKLFENPRFLADFEKAKAEWERIRGRNF